MSRRRQRVPGTTSRPRVLFVLPAIPDDAPERLKNAIALRNACSTTGVCPDCGTRGKITGPDARGFHHLTFEHEDGCHVLRDGAAA